MIRTCRFAAKLAPETHRQLEAFLLEGVFLHNAALHEIRVAYKKAKGTAKGKELKKALDDAIAAEAKKANGSKRKDSKKVEMVRHAYWNYIDHACSHVRFHKLCKMLTKLRHNYPEHEKWDAYAQRLVIKRVCKAFDAFIRRAKEGKERTGFPRYKSESRMRSFETQQFSIYREGKFHSVSVKGVGKFRFKGELPALDKKRYKNLIVVKTAKRVWICIACELSDVKVVDNRSPLGLDLGVENLYALSNRASKPGLKKDTSKVKHFQRKLAKTQGAKEGEEKSKAYKRAKASLAKEHQYLSERAHGQIHEITTDLVKNHSAKWYMEDLDIPDMTPAGKSAQRRGLNRSILNQCWGRFGCKLTYKAESAGGWVKKVDPRNTSKRCSKCGKVNKHIKLGDPMDCIYCGHKDQRDFNAASNMLPRDETGGLPVLREATA